MTKEELQSGKIYRITGRDSRTKKTLYIGDAMFVRVEERLPCSEEPWAVFAYMQGYTTVRARIPLNSLRVDTKDPKHIYPAKGRHVVNRKILRNTEHTPGIQSFIKEVENLAGQAYARENPFGSMMSALVAVSSGLGIDF